MSFAVLSPPGDIKFCCLSSTKIEIDGLAELLDLISGLSLFLCPSTEALSAVASLPQVSFSQVTV